MINVLIGWRDMVDAIKAWRVWLLLGWQDIRLRYRRSQLGPLWITISTSIMIGMMGFLYGHLFKSDLSKYYPFLAVGVVCWTFISTLINEANEGLIEAQSYIRQLKLPFYTYIFRLVTRNVIVLGHNFIPVLVVLMCFGVRVSFFQCIQLVIGFFLLLILSVSYGMMLAILGARFRDMKPIIMSLVQVVFFLTPIMWQPSMLSEKYRLAYELNPFYQIINAVRLPLTGHNFSLYGFFYLATLSLLGVILSTVLLSRVRHRIAYWV